MKNGGITIIELVVVISIIGILVASMVYSYQDWVERYEVERTTKELYADMMHARLRAMESGREHYLILNERSYSVAEDTNESGDYDDPPLPGFPKAVAHPLDWNDRHTVSKVIFESRGLMSELRTIRITSADADYNCIVVSQSRIITGKYVDGTCKKK
ncbi:MAG: type II secretion system protein [Nitrospiraceae bacterium]|nr:type II secretion system protein [Nitrospiraceae bacterium]